MVSQPLSESTNAMSRTLLIRMVQTNREKAALDGRYLGQCGQRLLMRPPYELNPL
jgi:hypothetical protein